MTTPTHEEAIARIVDPEAHELLERLLVEQPRDAEALVLAAADVADAREKARQIIAYRSQQEEGGWRPIESAPKDGTVIDVWRPEGGRDTVYWGYPPHECGEMGGLCDSDWHRIRAPGWVCNTFGEFIGRKHAPFTHWRPLPTPPQPSPKTEGGESHG